MKSHLMKPLWPDRFNRAEVQRSLFGDTVELPYSLGPSKKCSLISMLFSIYLTITGAKNVVRCAENASLNRGS